MTPPLRLFTPVQQRLDAAGHVALLDVRTVAVLSVHLGREQRGEWVSEPFQLGREGRLTLTSSAPTPDLGLASPSLPHPPHTLGREGRLAPDLVRPHPRPWPPPLPFSTLPTLWGVEVALPLTYPHPPPTSASPPLPFSTLPTLSPTWAATMYVNLASDRLSSQWLYCSRGTASGRGCSTSASTRRARSLHIMPRAVRASTCSEGEAGISGMLELR